MSLPAAVALLDDAALAVELHSESLAAWLRAESHWMREHGYRTKTYDMAVRLAQEILPES